MSQRHEFQCWACGASYSVLGDETAVTVEATADAPPPSHLVVWAHGVGERPWDGEIVHECRNGEVRWNG